MYAMTALGRVESNSDARPLIAEPARRVVPDGGNAGVPRLL